MLTRRALAHDSCHTSSPPPCTCPAAAAAHRYHARASNVVGSSSHNVSCARPTLHLSTFHRHGRPASFRCPKQLSSAVYSQADTYSTTSDEYVDDYYDDDDDDDYNGYSYYAEDDSEDSSYSDSDEDTDEGLEVHHVHSRQPLKCVALGDDFTHVIVFEDGDTAWSEGLSDGLYDTLTKTYKRGKKVASVAMGRNQGSDTYSTATDPDEVWFMMWNTGTTYMGTGCDEELRNEWWESEGENRVEKVVFAPNNGWHVSRRGGGEWMDNLPSALSKHIDKTWDTGDSVQSISVGHNGEYFALYESGRYIWSGVHPTLDRLLEKKKVGGRACKVEWVELGPDGTFVALFDTHTVWYGSEDLT